MFCLKNVWQIENEYGNIQGHYGQAGKRYMLWAAQMALALDTGVPWVMCRQTDAPEQIVGCLKIYWDRLHITLEIVKCAYCKVNRLLPCPFWQLNTCNAFYCDGFKPNSYNKPTIWTEDWDGWYVVPWFIQLLLNTLQQWI